MHPAMIGWLLLLFLLSAVPTAEAAGTTWLVNRAGDDVNNGDVATHSGSIRFALAHAVSGDLVKFGEFSADFIYVHSTLVVPAGVSVGGAQRGRLWQLPHTARQYRRRPALLAEASDQPWRRCVAAWY
jgi:hypothetical protein